MDERTELSTQAEAQRAGWLSHVRSLVPALAILAVIVGGLWYWDNRGDSSEVIVNGVRMGVVALPAERNPTAKQPVPEVGRSGPDFRLETPDGGTVRLSDLQGGPVLINFWATWCAPCRAEMPELVAAYERHQAQGLVVVAVNLQEADGQVERFAEEFGMTFPVAIDRNGEVADVWRLGGPIKGIPTSYFLDESGVIQEFAYGPMTAEMLEERLESILPETAD